MTGVVKVGVVTVVVVVGAGEVVVVPEKIKLYFVCNSLKHDYMLKSLSTLLLV